MGNSLQLIYRNNDCSLWQGDSIEWMSTLQSESVDLVIADPPYNIKKASWDTFKTQQDYINFTMKWVCECYRILKPNGTMYMFGLPEILSVTSTDISKLFCHSRWLVWSYKNKANLGSDWGRSYENIIHFRKNKQFTFNIDSVRIPYADHTLKYPAHPQSTNSQYSNKGKPHAWTPHPLGAKPKDVIEIPVLCNGMKERTSHPTQKPEYLISKLIQVSSNIEDVVVDPFCGSGTTPVCAEKLNRNWMSCDLNSDYLQLAVNRLQSIKEDKV